MDWANLKKKLVKEEPPKPKPATLKEKVVENIKSFGWALIIALLIKTFIVEATTVPTGSRPPSPRISVTMMQVRSV